MTTVACAVRLRANAGRSSQKICAAKKNEPRIVSPSPRPIRSVRQSTPASTPMPTAANRQLTATAARGQRRRPSATTTGIVTQ